MPNNPKTRNENLKKVFESLYFTNVQTVIASGNVIFETRKQNTSSLEKKIEQVNVFRFADEGRIVGYYNSNIFHIIFIDTGLTLWDHGS